MVGPSAVDIITNLDACHEALIKLGSNLLDAGQVSYSDEKQLERVSGAAQGVAETVSDILKRLGKGFGESEVESEDDGSKGKKRKLRK